MPSTEGADRWKLFEASGMITASATIALIERLLTIDWKVKGVRKVSGSSSEKTTISTASKIARFHTAKMCVAWAVRLRRGGGGGATRAGPAGGRGRPRPPARGGA